MVDKKKFHNLKTLFGVSRVPSDNHLRDIMDKIDSKQFRRIFTKLFAEVQRSKVFEAYEFIRLHDRPHYLINGDGTGYFRSDNIDCDGCFSLRVEKLIKILKNLDIMFLLPLLLIQISTKFFLFVLNPLLIAMELIKMGSGQNAFKIFIVDFRREHPKLDVVINLDALFATEPPIRLMMENDCSFIIGVKETNGTIYMQVKDG